MVASFYKLPVRKVFFCMTYLLDPELEDAVADRFVHSHGIFSFSAPCGGVHQILTNWAHHEVVMDCTVDIKGDTVHVSLKKNTDAEIFLVADMVMRIVLIKYGTRQDNEIDNSEYDVCECIIDVRSGLLHITILDIHVPCFDVLS